MNAAERNYSASESEMLSLVWAVKYFRCYLYGKRFVVRTDHSALTYLRSFADNNSRLLRWSLKLSEFDFIVEHRPGTKIAHADALSRHVGTVTLDDNLDKENIRSEQERDEFCSKQNPGALSRNREFFRDEEGVIYKRRPQGNHQIVVPRTLIRAVIKENHNPVYVAHPGIKRTYELISLNYWWPGMRQSIQEYIQNCDSCQKRKDDHEFVAPLGEPEEPTAPFEITSMDLTGPYPTTQRKNKYLLTFIDHFTKYVEAFAISDQTAETCARVYATQTITRHGTGSKLIADQGGAFMSKFFGETCKILGIQKLRTSSRHPISNGKVERLHRFLHAGLSHYVNATNTNWDVLTPFFLMAYRATPHTVSQHSPFYLLHGREMLLPNNDNLKAQISRQPPDHNQRLRNLKASLRLAYESIRRANRKSHKNNERLYNRSAKQRSFEPGDLVYLYNPAVRPGLSMKFHHCWSGPCRITAKDSDFNYKIMDQKNKQQLVHVNRLKRACSSDAWKPKTGRKSKKTLRRKPRRHTEGEEVEENEIQIGPFPLVQAAPQQDEPEPPEPLDPNLNTPEPTHQTVDTPASENRDPTYAPPVTLRSRRELQPTRTEPPITRLRARATPHETVTQGVSDN
jgi:transposase InsO family protein